MKPVLPQSHLVHSSNKMRLNHFVLLLFVLCWSSCQAERKRYHQFKVLKIHPNDEDRTGLAEILGDGEREIFILNIETFFIDRFVISDVQFWTDPLRSNSSVDFLVGPGEYSSVLKKLSQFDLRHEVRRRTFFPYSREVERKKLVIIPVRDIFAR